MGDAALIGDGDLAVERHCGDASSEEELFERCTKQHGAVVAVAADQLELAASNERDQAMPIVLHLMQPAVALRRLGAG